MIFKISHSLHACATGTTINIQPIFNTVANHSCVTTFAMWGKVVNRTLKAIK